MKKMIVLILSVLAGFFIVSFLFFRLTVAYSAPTGSKLNLPGDTAGRLSYSKDAITVILLDSNKIFYYSAADLKGGRKAKAEELRNVLATQKTNIGAADFPVTIKPTAGASYKNVIDALNQMLACNIKRYVTVKPSPAEEGYIESLQ